MSEATQPALFDEQFLASEPGADMVHRLRNPKIHNASLVKKDEERARIILEALKSGVSIRKAARAFKVSPNTIKALLADQETVDALMKKTVENLRFSVLCGSEELSEIMAEGRLQDSQVAWNTNSALGMLQLLTGQATSRVETSVKADSNPLAAFAVSPKDLDSGSILEIEATLLGESPDIESGDGAPKSADSSDISPNSDPASDSCAD